VTQQYCHWKFDGRADDLGDDGYLGTLTGTHIDGRSFWVSTSEADDGNVTVFVHAGRGVQIVVLEEDESQGEVVFGTRTPMSEQVIE